MFGKKIEETLKLIEIRHRDVTMPSMASSRSGFSMAMSTAHIVGIFEKENGDIFSLLMTEKQAADLRPGNTGKAVYEKNNLVSFHPV